MSDNINPERSTQGIRRLCRVSTPMTKAVLQYLRENKI